MTLNKLISRVRSYTNDNTASLFSTNDITDFINEAIDRLKHIPELSNMIYLEGNDDLPTLLPQQYHYILALYSASKCFSQDEQNYLAQLFMDEFLTMITLLENGIKDGTIIIVDSQGNSVSLNNEFDGVVDVYFTTGGGYNV